MRTGHPNSVNLDTILYNYIGTVWNITGTGVSAFGEASNCGTLICTDPVPFGTSGSRLQQIYMSFFSNGIWIRKRNGTTWSNWTCLRQNDNGAVPVSAGGTGATTPDGACANIGAVKKSGDTMTGPLLILDDIVQTTGYISGEAGTTDYALKLGHFGNNGMQFFEYSGQFDFYQSQSGTKTLLFQVKNGVSSKPLPVNNGGTGATDVPGAQNNILSGLFRLYDGGTVSNLAIGNRTAGRVTVYRYGPNTTGAPVSTAAGIAVLGVNIDNANYGWMLSTSDIGMYWRALDGGSYGAWKAIATP
jgi:hypothetical protein